MQHPQSPADGSPLGRQVAPAVTVMRARNVRAWPTWDQGDRVYVLPLARALTRAYRTDAHFSGYVSPRGRRLSSKAIEHGPVTLSVLPLDVDCPETHGTSEPAPESWRAELREKVRALAAEHPSPFVYMTRGGARILYTLAMPTVLATPEDARSWKQDYSITLCYLARRFELAADPACADWTRLFRLPRATRDEGGRPESWPTMGDPHNVGALVIEPSEADLAAAKRLLPRAFDEARRLEFTPANSNGEGLLYHALSARGDIVRAHGNAFVIRCPRESEHSCGRTGDGSTLLYLPAQGEQIGAIHCLHAHCAGLRVRDWLRCFSDLELAEARRAAGIADSRAPHHGDHRAA